MAMITLYLDIDGTLINTHERYDCNFPIARCCFDFLQFATENFNCKWLSFHTRGGRGCRVYDVFEEALGGKELSTDWKIILDRIEPAFWINKKTDGVDFKQDFIIVDDDCDPVDCYVLQQNNALDCLIPVYINSMPFDLLRVKAVLEELLECRENQANHK